MNILNNNDHYKNTAFKYFFKIIWGKLGLDTFVRSIRLYSILRNQSMVRVSLSTDELIVCGSKMNSFLSLLLIRDLMQFS